MMLLGPSVELVEDPGELAAAAAEAVARRAVALHHPRPGELAKPRREDGGTAPGALAKVGEGQGAPPQLPDQPQGPAPAEQVQDAFDWSGGGHRYGNRSSRR